MRDELVGLLVIGTLCPVLLAIYIYVCIRH
jgi:hypothetical protein